MAIADVLKLPVRDTIFSARIVKNLIFFKAQITASVANKQERVFRSKYPAYVSSGGTMIDVISAAAKAMQRTALVFIKERILNIKESKVFLRGVISEIIQVMPFLILYICSAALAAFISTNSS